MKSECTIMVRSDFITVHRPTMDVDRCPAMPCLVAVASLSHEGRHRAISKDVGRCTTMEVWTHNKSPLVLKWCDINGAFRLHRCASVDDGRRLMPSNAKSCRCGIAQRWRAIERYRKTSADVQRWKYERTISRHLYWNDVTLMMHSDFIAAHRSTNICVHNAGGHVQKAVSANVGWCKAIEVWMHSTTIFRFQGPPFWHENYRSTP